MHGRNVVSATEDLAMYSFISFACFVVGGGSVLTLLLFLNIMFMELALNH